jgi:hypothetical protein
MDFIESQGAVSDELTSVLLAISEKGWPLAVKHAAKTRETGGQFRRIQVANSREIRWRKPVKSAARSRSQRIGVSSVTPIVDIAVRPLEGRSISWHALAGREFL